MSHIKTFQVHGKDTNVNGYDSDDSDEASSTITPSLLSPSSNPGKPSRTQSNPLEHQGSQQSAQDIRPIIQASRSTEQQQGQQPSAKQTNVSNNDWYCNPANNSAGQSVVQEVVVQSSLPKPPSNDLSPASAASTTIPTTGQELHLVHSVLHQQHHSAHQHHFLQTHHHLHHHSIGGLISAVQSTY